MPRTDQHVPAKAVWAIPRLLLRRRQHRSRTILQYLADGGAAFRAMHLHLARLQARQLKGGCNVHLLGAGAGQLSSAVCALGALCLCCRSRMGTPGPPHHAQATRQAGGQPAGRGEAAAAAAVGHGLEQTLLATLSAP